MVYYLTRIIIHIYAELSKTSWVLTTGQTATVTCTITGIRIDPTVKWDIVDNDHTVSTVSVLRVLLRNSQTSHISSLPGNLAVFSRCEKLSDVNILQDSWVSTTGYKKSTLLAKAVTQDTSYECTFVINGKDYKMNVDADVVGECFR